MKRRKFEYGIYEVDIKSWNDFLTFVNNYLEYHNFIWRGQSDSSWQLDSSLERVLKKLNKIKDKNIVKDHLERFKFSTRGRRGLYPELLKSENDWWALGQHQGLYTPLLDWTKSPFVATFFTFSSSEKSTTGKRIVYGISTTYIKQKSISIKKNH